MVYWLVSLPHDDNITQDEVFNKIQNQLKGLCNIYHFKIPKLKVPSLNEIITLCDDIISYDGTLESNTMKILKTIQDMQDKEKEKENEKEVKKKNKKEEEEEYVAEVIIGDNKTSAKSYLQYFEWDESQYLLNKPIIETTERIYKKAMKFDEELRVKITEFSTLRSNINSIDRKQNGSLFVKPLDGIINEDQYYDSEFLTTLYVLVPKSQYKEWKSHYTSFEGAEYVLPDYTELIAEDKEYGLFNVVVIKKIAEDYKKILTKNRYVVREFKYDSKQFERSKQSYEDMKLELETMKKELMHWCKTGFSESFSSWVHIKTIRVFAESVLRYGVPPRFVTCLLHVTKNETSIHKILKNFYSNDEEDSILKSDKTLERGDNYPYVLIKINTNYPLLNMDK